MDSRKRPRIKEVLCYPVPSHVYQINSDIEISLKSSNSFKKRSESSKKRSNNRFFCTYGDKRFKESRERIIKEAESINLFDKCILYTDSSLKEGEYQQQKINKEFNKVASAFRGGGYYIWKPFILFNTLNSINSNDTLIYTDAGSSIINNHKYIEKLNSLIIEIENSKYGVLGCRSRFTEKDWTKGDVFNYFNFYNNLNVTHTRQFNAGALHIAKKCSHSLNIYSKWWETAKKRPELFDDSISKAANFPGFQENRHDQSVWSVLCKKFGVVEINDFDSPVSQTRIRR